MMRVFTGLTIVDWQVAHVIFVNDSVAVSKSLARGGLTPHMQTMS